MKSGGPADAKLQFVQKINNSISNALLAYHTYDFLLKPAETHLPAGLRPCKVKRSSAHAIGCPAEFFTIKPYQDKSCVLALVAPLVCAGMRGEIGWPEATSQPLPCG